MKDDVLLELIENEQQRQEETLGLIASENFTSRNVRLVTGSILTNKYAEGLPGKRYYGGCEIIDQIEKMAIERAKALFHARWVNVQPHSGSQANAAVMLAVLRPGDKILGFNLAHGGHLTHGSSVNFSGKLYNASFYGVDQETGYIDWDVVAEQALEQKPQMIICGASAYSRDWNYVRLRQIADEVGAFLLADIAHPAGLIARGLLNDPIPHCHFVTTTTHKTLRGPRGGMILIGKDYENPLGITTRKKKLPMLSSMLDASVFPGTQGGPLEHVIAAKAVAFGEALSDTYFKYIVQVQKNARKMAQEFINKHYKIISNGTDNHLILIDLCNKKLTGNYVETILEKANIIVNKNLIPFDKQSPAITSGIRLGSAAITTRGLQEEDMIQVVEFIDSVLKNHEDDRHINKIKQEVRVWMKKFPLTNCAYF